jgi:hypothetical protein
VGPTAWEPYSPPPVSPTAWEPYSPPPVGPTAWEPYSPPPAPVGPNAWEPYVPPRPAPSDGNNQPNYGRPGGWSYHQAITHVWFTGTSAGTVVWVHGTGWKQLSTASGPGHGHLVMLAATAKSRRIYVDYHEDAHGRIDQLVV